MSRICCSIHQRRFTLFVVSKLFSEVQNPNEVITKIQTDVISRVQWRRLIACDW
jgi:hypothetical protein